MDRSFSMQLLYLALSLILVTLLFMCRMRSLPGPIAWPLIGSALQIPKPLLWTWYQPMSKIYGPIFRLKVFRDNLVVISDPKIAEELIGRNSLNYSSRKHLPYAGKYRSNGKRMLLMPYGADFVKQRSAMQLLFRPEGITSNRTRQRQQALKLLIDFHDRAGRWNTHLKSYASGVALGVAFGMTVASAHKRMPQMLGNTTSLGQDLAPGRWLVETFPWLDYLPDIFSPWRASARAVHKREIDLFMGWADEARNQDPGALKSESLVAQLWRLQDDMEIDDETIAYVGGSVGEAGTNTTQCVLACFLYACILWPDAIRNAQREIDDVVGDRPPEFSDYANLPHTFAVVKESLRWVPVTPLALPHLASQSDIYQGYHVPKDSLVITSIWNMHRDPKFFANPDIFDPNRFYAVTPEGKVPSTESLLDGIWTFGFGRRVCPGRRLGADSVWLAICHILWAFNIHSTGQTSDLLHDPFSHIRWRDAVNVEPKSLPFYVTSRSDERERRVRADWEELMHTTI